MEKLAYSIDELLEIHPSGRTSLFAEIKAGRLVARKLGSRTIILTQDYVDFLTSLPVLGDESADDADGSPR